MEQTTTTNTTWALGLGIVGLLIISLIALGFYIFVCYCCKRICEKAGKNPGVLIWIPIVNLIPLLEVAGLPLWTIILFFIPVAQFVIGIIMWAKICVARGKSPWLVILFFLPIPVILFLIILAFSE